LLSRRSVLVAVPACASALRLGAQPLTSRPKRIGILFLGGPPLNWEPSFWGVMKTRNWVLGDNIVVEYGYGNWDRSRLAAAAADLAKRVDVIICNGDVSSAVAAGRATKTVPIVFYDAFAPIEQGLIDSFAKPGRNLTGTSGWSGIEFATKRLEFLRAVSPTAKRLAWIVGADSLVLESLNGNGFDLEAMIKRAAQQLGFEARVYLAQAPESVEATLKDVTTWAPDAICAGGWPTFVARRRIGEFALKSRIPSAFSVQGYLAGGGLLSYGVPDGEDTDLQSRWIGQIDRVLRGASPATIPVEQPTVYKLVINMKTARAIGLKVPHSLLARADEVVEL
jgi:putative tryptophan/tyrosine transport system substrate-binding protein